MNPAFSVLLLTTLIGAGQGLFIVLHALEWLGWANGGTHLGVTGSRSTSAGFFAWGGAAALALTGAGLVASTFHLGRPERGWRAAAMWRTSWLSREVIVLPLFMLGTFVWTLQHFMAGSVAGSVPGSVAGQAFGSGTLVVGAATALLALALFVCTAMIYACLRFIREWASAYTLANFTLMGLASGTLCAAWLASLRAPTLVPVLAQAAFVLTLAALATRALSLARNARLVPPSTVQTAVGIRHPQLRQRSMGFMGGSFNTREFFHGRSAGTLRWVRWAFIVLAFVLPMAGLAAVAWRGVGDAAHAWLLALSALLQWVGLLVERWFFFAQANHPQNLYYRAVS